MNAVTHHNVYQLIAQLLVDGDLDQLEWAILDQLMPGGWDDPEPGPWFPHL